MSAPNDILATIGAEARGAVINVVCKSSDSAETVQNDKRLVSAKKDAQRITSDKESPYADLMAEYGPPLTYGDKGQLYWNEAFFAGKFAAETELLFSPEENRFYAYEKKSGLWSHQTDAWLRQQVFKNMLAFARAESLEHEIPFDLDDRHQRALASQLKGIAEQRNAFNLSHGLIHVQNGMLDLSSGAAELKGFDPIYRSRNQVPFPYDPKAICPRFLDDLLKPALSADDIELFQRWCGSLLIGKNRAQRIMVVTGIAGGGKSTLLSIVESINGEQNLAELRIDQLGGRFEKSRFIGKQLLVGKDVRSDYLTDKAVSYLKSLVGGDRMTAELKGANEVIALRGNFSVAITSNAALRLKLDDDADAWRRRLLLIPFAGKKPGKPIPDFEGELVRNEGKGILAWMVEGAIKHMAELKSCGGYILTATQAARIQTMLAESNSVQEFIGSRIVSDKEMDVTTDELLSAYEDYCTENDWTPAAAKSFREQVKHLMAEQHGVHQSHDIKRLTGVARGYRRVRIAPRQEVSADAAPKKPRRSYDAAQNAVEDARYRSEMATYCSTSGK